MNPFLAQLTPFMRTSWSGSSGTVMMKSIYSLLTIPVDPNEVSGVLIAADSGLSMQWGFSDATTGNPADTYMTCPKDTSLLFYGPQLAQRLQIRLAAGIMKGAAQFFSGTVGEQALIMAYPFLVVGK